MLSNKKWHSIYCFNLPTWQDDSIFAGALTETYDDPATRSWTGYKALWEEFVGGEGNKNTLPLAAGNEFSDPDSLILPRTPPLSTLRCDTVSELLWAGENGDVNGKNHHLI